MHVKIHDSFNCVLACVQYLLVKVQTCVSRHTAFLANANVSGALAE